MPLCLDLCCGKGGWAEGFLAADYEVVGIDIKDHGYPGKLFLHDVREISVIAAKWAGLVDVIVASPPCQEFSLRGLPWGRAQKLPPPDMSIVKACYDLRDLISPRLFLLENVRGAQPWIGRAPLHRGPFYFWGDVALLPQLSSTFKKGVRWGTYKSAGTELPATPYIGRTVRSPTERAKIPYELAYGFALLCRQSIPHRGGIKADG